MRFRVLNERRCAYCGVQLLGKKAHREHPRRLTHDHVWPRTLKGELGKKNQVRCCYSCNQRKGRLTLEEWRQEFFGSNVGLFYFETVE